MRCYPRQSPSNTEVQHSASCPSDATHETSDRWTLALDLSRRAGLLLWLLLQLHPCHSGASTTSKGVSWGCVLSPKLARPELSSILTVSWHLKKFFGISPGHLAAYCNNKSSKKNALEWLNTSPAFWRSTGAAASLEYSKHFCHLAEHGNLPTFSRNFQCLPLTSKTKWLPLQNALNVSQRS